MKVMEQYNLDTAGKADDLRRRFSSFWKSQARHGTQEPIWQGGPGSPGFASCAPESLPVPSRHLQVPNIVVSRPEEAAAVVELGRELENVKMILGLSPNADSRTLRETLASVVRQSRSGTPDNEAKRPFDGLAAPPVSGFSFRPEMINPPVVNQERPHRPENLGFSTRSDDRRAIVHAPSQKDSPTVCNIVRKWGLKFDGRRDPVSFLERIQELMESYSLTNEELMKALPELLQGSALLWYRNCKDSLYSFDAFLRKFEIQFLPPGYRRNLDEEIRMRTQGENEPFRDFVTAIMTLIRRSAALSEQGKLDVIYKNMRPDYKLMVRRQDCSSLADMMDRAEDYEAYLRIRPASVLHLLLV